LEGLLSWEEQQVVKPLQQHNTEVSGVEVVGGTGVVQVEGIAEDRVLVHPKGQVVVGVGPMTSTEHPMQPHDTPHGFRSHLGVPLILSLQASIQEMVS
jgi:hypothetical protein